jgi:hypothetical protein
VLILSDFDGKVGAWGLALKRMPGTAWPQSLPRGPGGEGGLGHRLGCGRVGSWSA